MTELLVITLVLLVGVLIGISFPLQASLADIAAYSGIVSGVIALVSFILAVKLYLKWKKPLDSADTKAIVDVILQLSSSNLNCASIILSYDKDLPGKIFTYKLVSELNSAIVKIKGLEVIAKRSHIFANDDDFILKIQQVNDKLHRLMELSPWIHHRESRQEFADLNTECQTAYYKLCEFLSSR